MREWNYENEQWTKLPGHIKHLPLFTRHLDLVSIFFRYLWALVLKSIFSTYIQLQVKGDWKALHREYPKLLIISNHGSHLDAVSIAASIPMQYWTTLFIAAAKDYFFSNFVFTFFSQHCLGAIPFDRKDKRGEAVTLTINLLNQLDRMWLILFPEGTRSKDGKVHDFKRGVSIFAERTSTPILFLYVEGNSRLMPKGQNFPSPGRLTIHIGPVHPPAPVEVVYAAYKEWGSKISPESFIHDQEVASEMHPSLAPASETLNETEALDDADEQNER